MAGPVCKFKPLSLRFEAPFLATEGAACFDFFYCGAEAVTLFPVNPIRDFIRKLLRLESHPSRAALSLGCAVELPKGYELQLRPRSGLAAKNGITVLNSPGTIDSDYRGEVKVILINLGSDPVLFKPGDRVCQGAFRCVDNVGFAVVSELSETVRGESGFGSTKV